ncbi:tripartite tricarboxylate transporter substrate binding protein [Cupriavidus respiraculi]|uniref:tripartite tricarboxylate transporter substrate binding protein n=1 Tax=Cupriavidus respiraculi TaxID=195930 RepID=UPI001C96AA3B|nr:tripartite tricarboxylate transporter substrate binding protein [Cupriavidus respiraculi]MBY4947987.1 tripartite tricarboxylate transporter substrate binding protein [Cupriavidus respiraculi]
MPSLALLRIPCVLLALGLAATSPSAAAAAPYPSEPIRIIVGYQAGGPTDLTARLLASKLQASLGQPVIVENKPGAGSNIASEYVAAAPPDGYTLLLAAAPITMTKFLYKGLKFDVQKSFEPIANVMNAPAVLAVSPKLPARDLQSLIALAKQRPGSLTFGSTGTGGSQHLAGELLKQRAGIDLLHVPYKGASTALTDLMAGTVDMVFMTSMSALPALKSGNPRALAVASKKRLPQMPDLPTMDESGLPGFEADSWNGLLAPAKTPAAVLDRLNAEVNKALASPEVRDALVSQGAVVVGGSRQEFRQYLDKEVERWSTVFKTVKISL